MVENNPLFEERLHVVYHISCSKQALEQRALALALEQSVEMPLSGIVSRFVLEEIVARIERTEEISEGLFSVELSFSSQVFDGTPSQLFNILIGNASLLQGVVVHDIRFVPRFLSQMFSGPPLGIPVLRQRLGIFERALTCSALKPQGSPLETLVALACALAEGGVDIIKDDHNLANQAFSPTHARIKAIGGALRRLGTAARYAPHVTGSLDAVRQTLDVALEEGIDTVLIAPMLLGVENFLTVRSEYPQMAFLAHPSLGGVSSFSPSLLLGKLYRLLGADAVIFPSFGGRFGFSKAECHLLAQHARASLAEMLPAFPVPAGGMTVARVPEILEFYGRETMLLIGGDVLLEPDHIEKRARLFCDAVARFKG